MARKKAKMTKKEIKDLRQLDEMKTGMDAVTESQIRVGANYKNAERMFFRGVARISGTSAGWIFSEHLKQGCDCSEKPGFKHYLFEC